MVYHFPLWKERRQGTLSDSVVAQTDVMQSKTLTLCESDYRPDAKAKKGEENGPLNCGEGRAGMMMTCGAKVSVKLERMMQSRPSVRWSKKEPGLKDLLLAPYSYWILCFRLETTRRVQPVCAQALMQKQVNSLEMILILEQRGWTSQSQSPQVDMQPSHFDWANYPQI